MAKRPARVITFPRVPLPRQTGGVHKVKTKINPRKAKYRRKPTDFLEDCSLPLHNCKYPA